MRFMIMDILINNNNFLGSFPNSRRQIEPELLRIIMHNWRLDDLLSKQLDNSKLTEALKLVQSRITLGSLAAYDNFEFDELYWFRQIYRLETEDTITDTEIFPGEMMSPKKIGVSLPDDIYDILVDYYNAIYDSDFVSIAESVQRSTEHSIIILPRINQFGRIRIGSEIFGSANTPRYLRNSFILAKFVQDDDSIELFPGQVQYFFEHEVNLPEGKQTHSLVYVRWFLPAPMRFHCQIGNDYESCNVEIWGKRFYDLGRDSIIPIHNIYSRFIPTNFQIGIRKHVTYMAVVPIGRRFHL